ncbi:MAG: phenylacetate--CoA ligase family protein [Acidimicrobiales bacterium]
MATPTRPLGEDRYWNKPTQTAPREVLDAWHLERIQHLIGWSYRNSPLYRRIYDDAGIKPEDIKTWDDFHHRLPFTDKPDFLADQEQHPSGFGGLALPADQIQMYFHTTGTTGRFLNEGFTQFEMQRSATQYCYSLWDHGIRPGDSMYLCFNFGMWIGLWSIYWGARNLNLRILAGGGSTSIERVRHILQHRPTIVVGTPTYLLHLVEVARSEGHDLREAGVQALFGGGEPGFSVPVTRQSLMDGWGLEQVIDGYGIGETMHVAQSCADWGGGVHTIEDVAHSYTADPDSGEPLLDGQIGENIITSYTHFSQPFIKYRSHDLVQRDDHPDHGCGWTWSHLPGVVLGRADFMVTIRGTNVYPTAVENLIGGVDGLSNHYELHIARPATFDEMTVKVEAATAGANHGALATQLDEHFRRNLGVRLGVEILQPGSLPRYELKTKRIFDTREAAR